MKSFRDDFPYFNRETSPVFFDSAASTQKPDMMIKRLTDFYSYEYSNVHRGSYDLSSSATKKFEQARQIVSNFINSRSAEEIVFTKNATEGINLIAHSFGKDILSENDEVLISAMEHHSNIIPWQQICTEKKARLIVIPVDCNGDILLKDIKNLLSSKTKIIAITHMSNVFGSVVDVQGIAKLAKEYNTRVVVDACQSIAHVSVDVQKIDCDFLVFSAHKLYGPTGVGVLYGKRDVLESMIPYQTGGAVISKVTFNESYFLGAPQRFEAGTPMIAEVIAFGSALEYLRNVKWHEGWLQEKKIAQFLREEIRSMTGFHVLGNNNNGIISLVHEKAHHSDIGEILNQQNVCIRTGYHCAQPLMDLMSLPGVARISVGIYNDFADAKIMVESLRQVNKLF
jgi:cysteine desulfurase/selenocysteine lyase